MPYVTVFDITQRPFEWWWSAFGLAFIAIGVVLIRFGPQIDRFASGAPSRIVGWCFVVFASGWTLLAFGGTYAKYLEYRHAYQNGQYSIVEGLVEDFSPMPYEGHRDECFRVSRKLFCYSDYNPTPAFHQSASHGGPIRDGLPVRIAYYDGQILRLDIHAGSLPSADERASYAKTEEAKWYDWTKNNPTNDRFRLAFSLACMFISLCWNLDWRHYMRYWIKNGPPYKPIWETIFRVFFLACLFGSTINLIQAIAEKHRTLADFARASLYSLFWVGFFGVFDLFFRLKLRAKKQAITTS